MNETRQQRGEYGTRKRREQKNSVKRLDDDAVIDRVGRPSPRRPWWQGATQAGRPAAPGRGDGFRARSLAVADVIAGGRPMGGRRTGAARTGASTLPVLPLVVLLAADRLDRLN